VNEPTAQPAQPAWFTLPLSRPIVTWILLAAILVVFAAETLAGGSTSLEVLVRMGAKVTPLIAAGQYWRLFTSMFLHIGIMHLLFNGYALIVIGIELERLFGPWRFLSLYLLAGLFGSLASYAFSSSLAAGASGAIFGLIGGLAAFFALHRERLGTWGRRRLGNIVFLIVLNLFLGFTQPGIDNLAHLGGLLSGMALGWAMAPRYELDPIRLQLGDRNQLGRYWPALALAAVLLVGGITLVTQFYRHSWGSSLLHGQQTVCREVWDEAATGPGQAVAAGPEDIRVPVHKGQRGGYTVWCETGFDGSQVVADLQAQLDALPSRRISLIQELDGRCKSSSRPGDSSRRLFPPGIREDSSDLGCRAC
jgi:rhomboid protease GluP